MNRKLEVPLVKDILINKVFALKPDFSSFDAIKFFNKNKISSAPVVNESNEVIGYLSESDCIKDLSNSLFYDETSSRAICHIMSNKVTIAECEWGIFELESFFVANHLRSAPVVDSKNHLVGIITRSDALVALEKCLEKRQEYKSEIKNPVELNMREQVRMIVNLHKE